MSRTKLFPLVLVVGILMAPKSLFAFIGGCVDSPEDPTVVMALVGACAAVAPVIWSRRRGRG
jgi:hypothetical protein